MSSPTTAPATPLRRIGQICINVHDLDRAVAFYRDTLGMTFLFQVPKLAFFQCGEVRVMLGLPDTPEFDHPSSIIYFAVDDIESVHAAYQKRGVAFRSEPQLVHKAPDHDLWLADFRDLDGNTLALMCEKRRA